LKLDTQLKKGVYGIFDPVALVPAAMIAFYVAVQGDV
jgi:hypothetical protein